MLIAPFTEEETKLAIWNCESSKSLGPDGFNFRFFKEFLHILNCDIMRLMHKFFHNRTLVKG